MCVAAIYSELQMLQPGQPGQDGGNRGAVPDTCDAQPAGVSGVGSLSASVPALQLRSIHLAPVQKGCWG